MQTMIYSCHTPKETQEAIAACSALLTQGELVAFPTETVYGLGANALNPAAVQKIYQVKNRPANNPLIAHIADFDMLDQVASSVPSEIRALTAQFWPGPLTVVLPRAAHVPPMISAGLSTVAVRCPAHPLALKLIRAAGVPIVAPSANLSGRPSPTCLAHCEEDLMGKVAAIMDGGSCRIGVESTVVAPCGAGKLRLLRPGGISIAMLEQTGFQVELDPAILSPVQKGQKVSSPGMLYKHYAPKAPMTIVTGEPQAVCAAIQRKEGPGVWVLAFDEYMDLFHQALSFGSIQDPLSQTQALFDALRRFDHLPCNQIYAMNPSREGVGLAVCNRLLRAAAFRVVPAERL